MLFDAPANTKSIDIGIAELKDDSKKSNHFFWSFRLLLSIQATPFTINNYYSNFIVCYWCCQKYN